MPILAFWLAGFVAGAGLLWWGDAASGLPSWLAAVLGPFFALWWLSVPVMIGGRLLRRSDRARRFSRPVTAFAAVWLGLILGFMVVGVVTCAFCLA